MTDREELEQAQRYARYWERQFTDASERFSARLRAFERSFRRLSFALGLLAVLWLLVALWIFFH